MVSVAVGRAISKASRKALTGRKEFSTLFAVTEEYPGLPSTSPEPSKVSSPSVTTLSSGLTVVTEDAASTSTVTLTYPKAGSGAEALGEHGAALINKCLAFNSGSGLSTVLINRSIENEGATPLASADRRSATLGYTVEPDNAVGLIPLLATDCTFEKWDVRDAKKLAAYQVAEASKSAQIVLTEQIYAAAYGPQSTMGRPFYCADASTQEIVDFRQRGYGLNGAILTATGVKDHAAFCTEAEALLSESPVGNSEGAPVATYLGGEGRVSAPSAGHAHVALAFETDMSIPLRSTVKHVLELLGKEANVSAFDATGLIGVYACAPSEAVGGLEAALSTTVTTSPSADIVNRAKVLAKAESMFAMDSGSLALAASMTASVMESGSAASVSEIAAAFDAITEKDVSAAIASALKSNPSLAAIGDIGVVPYQGTFASRFA